MKPPLSLAASLALASSALAAPGFSLSSPAFNQGASIPPAFTCDGAGLSPTLRFAHPPAGTRSFAILGWDDDAPGGLASTWVVYDIPAGTKELLEGMRTGSDQGVRQGRNTYGKLGYSAPCPAKGKAHHYYFDLYALDVPSLGLPPGASLARVHAAIRKHRIQEAKLLGLYRR